MISNNKYLYAPTEPVEEVIDAESIIPALQEFLTKNYHQLIDKNDSANHARLRELIRQYLITNHMSPGALLVERLFDEVAGFSFLSGYLTDPDVEEINIISWDNVAVIHAGGRTQRLETFQSAEHAFSIIKRLLQKSNMILDAGKPVARGHLSSNIRITAFCPPVVDKSAGVVCSIRIVNPKKLSFLDFIKNGTGSEPMLEFLRDVYRYGLSICISGSTNSGKTTLMSWIMSELPNDARLITIENGTREFDLKKVDENGVAINQVIHLVTKESEDEKDAIDQQSLLSATLTSNPSHICMSEMKNAEADAAQEAARTGHAVITTIHANSASAIPLRMMTLCKMGRVGGHVNDEKLLMQMIVEAFPVLVHMKSMEDGKRRIVEICELAQDGVKCLFSYAQDKGFRQQNHISGDLSRRLREGFMPEEALQNYQRRLQ